jgi:exopolysaccharide production protein ExoY
MNAISRTKENERTIPGIPPWKRALDFTLILLASPLLIPAVVVVAALVRLVSRGPILFRQERIGWNGRKFVCFKFRTMYVGSESCAHEGHLRELIQSNVPMVKLDARDPRIIPGGLLLRASGLDELPQLINVLRGEMSLVGPRPCLPYEFAHYLPWQRERCNAAPGLTGLWQVSGKNRTTFTEMIRLDIEYGRRRSLWLDLVIIARTIPALVLQMLDGRRAKTFAARATGARPAASNRFEPDIFQAPVIHQ